MSHEQIGNYLDPKFLDKTLVTINLKVRGSIKGLFIQRADYLDLKAKNFWRVVTEANIENYRRSNDLSFSRIFSGFEITKLSAL